MKFSKKLVATGALALLSAGSLGFGASPAAAAESTCYVSASNFSQQVYASSGKLTVKLTTQPSGLSINMKSGQAGKCSGSAVLEGPRNWNGNQNTLIDPLNSLRENIELPQGWYILENGVDGMSAAPFVRTCGDYYSGCDNDTAPFGA